MTAGLSRGHIHILITDDDAGMRHVLGEIVSELGPFAVNTASCGDEALAIASKLPVHLALLDMQMPRLSGLETLKRMRQVRQNPLPAILITADASAELDIQAERAEVFRVIPKPFRKTTVTSTVVQALVRFYGDNVLNQRPSPTPEDAQRNETRTAE
jgi:CheY-like chemotaxis protein